MFNRPIVIITISYILGILMGLYLKISIAPFLYFIGGILGLFFCHLHKITNKSIYRKKIIYIAIITFLLSFSAISVKEYKYKTLYNGVGEDIRYVGTVVAVKEESKYYYNYVVMINHIKDNSKCSGTKVLLQVKKNKENNMGWLKYGDMISGIGNFEKPMGKRNYGGYDYSQYLKSKKIYMICKSEYNNIRILKKNPQYVINMWISMLNTKLKANLCRLLPSEYASVAMSFLLGDTSVLNSEQSTIFSNAGLSHVLAISGMHIAYVVMGCALILKKFGNRKSKYLTIFILVFFSFLTGGNTSLLRAVIMCSMNLIAKLLHRKSDTINNISVACLILLIYNPYIILNLDFQLSFVGTLGIVLVNPKLSSVFTSRVNLSIRFKVIDTLMHKIFSIIILSISVNICIIPIIVYRLNTISCAFIISNLMVTPILGFMFGSGYITLLISLISLKWAKFILFPFKLCISMLCLISRFSSNIVFLRHIITTPKLIFVIFYYIVIIYLLFFFKNSHKKRIIITVIFTSIILIFVHFFQLYNIGFRLFFVDVGQGDSSLIVTNNNTRILLDGGGSEGSDYDVGERVLVPYLLDRGIYKIDYVVISHFDSDHCKGLFTVIEKLNVKNVVISKQGEFSKNYEYFLGLASARNVNIIYIRDGDRIQIDNTTYIDFFWPKEELVRENILNNNSIVCKFNYKNISVLFTGDIEEIAEKRIITEYRKCNVLNSSILKVAHHGSKTSSTQEFLELVKPKIALVGVGTNNNFGHPSNSVIEKLENLRCTDL